LNASIIASSASLGGSPRGSGTTCALSSHPANSVALTTALTSAGSTRPRQASGWSCLR
jgi:hypothetical protein